jgi:hypothetical protein
LIQRYINKNHKDKEYNVIGGENSCKAEQAMDRVEVRAVVVVVAVEVVVEVVVGVVRDVVWVAGLPRDQVGIVSARTAGIRHHIRCKRHVIISSVQNAAL